ncbi:hypothetical protein CBF23_014535 [Marinomonas agarivorans]|nr:hypothetical protein CBF23_014535 [Marinomonas agarivorans]
MKKLILLSGLVSTVSFAAQPIFHPIGASSTLGSVTNSRALSTSFSNPASGYLMVNHKANDSFRFGLIGPIGIGYELGEVDSLIDEIDELEDILDNGVSSTAEANAAQAKFNDFLQEAGEKGYAKATVAGAAPFFPIIYKSQKYGAVALDFTFAGVGKLNILDDTLTITAGSGANASTDSSSYVQSAASATVGLGYSNSIWETGYGDLVVGLKANATQLESTRTVETLDSDVATEIEGDASSSAVGIDAGFLWVADNVVFGVTMANINEPEYDLGSLDNSDCTGSRCTQLNNLITGDGIATTGGIYVAEAQTTVELSLSLANKQLSLQTSYDTNSVKDVVGDEYQWAVASLSYYGDSNFLPGLRVGLRQNMVGTELSYANAGLTFFKRLNLDVGVALETIEVDETELPRAGYVNLGFTSAF